MKKIVLFALIFTLMVLCACAKQEEKPVPSSTPVITREPVKPTASPIPTEGPTPTLAPTPTVAPTPWTPTVTEVKVVDDAEYSFYYCDHDAQNGVTVLKETIAVRMNLTYETKALYFSCPSMNDDAGTLNFAVYKYDGSYDSTIEGNAVFEQSFENYPDNSLLKVKRETPFEAGEYIVLLTSPDPENGVGVWTKLAAFDGQMVYLDGEPQTDVALSIQITYTKTPDIKVGQLSE